MAATILSSTGCGPVILGPNLGALGYPIPVSPYFQKKEEDAFWNHSAMSGTGARSVAPGSAEIGSTRPFKDEVIRALEKARPVQGGIPFLHEVQREGPNHL